MLTYSGALCETHAHISIRMYTLTYTNTQWHTHVHNEVHICTQTYTYILAYTCGPTYRRTPVQTKEHVHIIIDPHLHILMYTCTHLHTPVHTDVQISPWICSCKEWNTLLLTNVCRCILTYASTEVHMYIVKYSCAHKLQALVYDILASLRYICT